jgi:hypothetical protein
MISEKLMTSQEEDEIDADDEYDKSCGYELREYLIIGVLKGGRIEVLRVAP